MDESLSIAHHNLYEYASNLLRLINEDDKEDTVTVDKDSISQLAAAYQHLYSDVYINQRIRPLSVLLNKTEIQ